MAPQSIRCLNGTNGSYVVCCALESFTRRPSLLEMTEINRQLPGVKGQWIKVSECPPPESENCERRTEVNANSDNEQYWRPADSSLDDRPFLQESRILTLESMQKWAFKDPLVHRAIQARYTELQLIEALVENRERLVAELRRQLSMSPQITYLPQDFNANSNP